MTRAGFRVRRTRCDQDATDDRDVGARVCFDEGEGENDVWRALSAWRASVGNMAPESSVPDGASGARAAAARSSNEHLLATFGRAGRRARTPIIL